MAASELHGTRGTTNARNACNNPHVALPVVLQQLMLQLLKCPPV